MHAPSPLPGPQPPPWPDTGDRRAQRRLAQISALTLVANVGGILASVIYCLLIGKWWGIFLVWIAFSLGPIKVGYWPTVIAVVVLWVLDLRLVAILVLVTLLLETLLVRQERRLERESVALGERSSGHHRPVMAAVGSLSRSEIEDNIRSVFAAEGSAPAVGVGAFREIWRDERYSQVAPGMAANDVGLLCADGSHLRLLDPSSGEELWSVATCGDVVPHAVVPVDNDFLLYYRMPEIEDDVVGRVHGATGAVLWQRRQCRSPDPVACASRAVVVDDRSLMMVDAAGDVDWSTAPFDLGPRELASDGSRIAVLDLSNRVAMLDGYGELLWRVRLDDEMRDAKVDSPRELAAALAPTRTVMLVHLALGEGAVVVTGERGAVCLDASDGTTRWSAPQRGGWTRPRISGGRVLIGVPDELTALSLETGDLVWRREFGDHPITGASCAGTRVVVTGRRELHRLTLADGETESIAVGSAGTPTNQLDLASVAKLMRGLTPVAAPDGYVVSWVAGVGIVGVGG